jgi:hypothetical protein
VINSIEVNLLSHRVSLLVGVPVLEKFLTLASYLMADNPPKDSEGMTFFLLTKYLYTKPQTAAEMCKTRRHPVLEHIPFAQFSLP